MFVTWEVCVLVCIWVIMRYNVIPPVCDCHWVAVTMNDLWCVRLTHRLLSYLWTSKRRCCPKTYAILFLDNIYLCSTLRKMDVISCIFLKIIFVEIVAFGVIVLLQYLRLVLLKLLGMHLYCCWCWGVKDRAKNRICKCLDSKISFEFFGLSKKPL